MLEMLGQHSSLGIAVSDLDGNVSFTTPGLERMLDGVRRDTLNEYVETMALRDPVSQRPLGREDLPLERAARGEVVTDDVLSLQRADGRTVYLRCNAAPLRHEDGEIRGAIVLVQDVTPEWRALLKQRELRDRLVNTVHHELRTPLTIIVGHSELLVEAAEDGMYPAHLAGSASAVLRASRKLVSLANRVSQVADLDAATRVQRVSADVVDVLRSAIQAQDRLARSRAVEVHLVAPSELPATVDPALLARAVRELLANAVCYAPRESTVSVSLQRLGDNIEICVADLGPGVPSADRQRLLEPFETGQLPQGSTNAAGLGLAVVSAIVAAHGGTIELADNHPHGLVACVQFHDASN